MLPSNFAAERSVSQGFIFIQKYSATSIIPPLLLVLFLSFCTLLSSVHREESADLGLFPVLPPPRHMTLGRAFNLLVPVYPGGESQTDQFCEAT